MVFESIIADLLNQVIGDYVENLDAKQLSVGIWAGEFITIKFRCFVLGNLELTDLVIKETALDSLDFPLKLKFGCLDKLVLKIPWTNLYEAPVIAEVEGLYMIIVPNRGVPYNEENAKKLDFKRKQNALERLEQKKKQIRGESYLSDFLLVFFRQGRQAQRRHVYGEADCSNYQEFASQHQEHSRSL
jgi:vacuolar protein sorting-associated protein 13A/C